MNVMLRVAAVTIALAVPAAVLALWMPTPHSSEGSVELRIPDRVGRWTATADREFAPEIVARLGADAHILRRYEAPGRDPLWLFVSLYAGLGGHGSGAKYHDPEDCYPGQGWEISDYQPLEVRVSTSETLHAKLLQVQQGNLRQAVVYWFQPARRWPATRAAEELLRIFDAVTGNPQYAFVRVSSLDPKGTARDDLIELVAELAPRIRAEVEALGSSQ